MDLTVILYAVGTLIALFGAIGGAFAFWSNMTNRMVSNKMTADSAMTSALHANARIDLLVDEFSKQREITARNISKLETTNDSLAQAIRDMTGSLRHVVERLDRVVERLPVFDHRT